jgi:hypothetical protein
MFEESRAPKGDARQASLSNAVEVRPLHEDIVKIHSALQGLIGSVKFTKFDRGKISFCAHKSNRLMSYRQV